MRTLRAAFTAGLVLALLAPGPNAWSCTCPPGLSHDDYVRSADAVFTGTVVRRSAGRPERTSRDAEGRPIRVLEPGTYRWTFDVDGVGKGRVSDRQDVESRTQEPACGYMFELGRRYEVFAREGDDGTLTTGWCSGNRSLASGVLYPPPGGASLPRTGSAGATPLAVLAVVVALSAIAARHKRRAV